MGKKYIKKYPTAHRRNTIFCVNYSKARLLDAFEFYGKDISEIRYKQFVDGL